MPEILILPTPQAAAKAVADAVLEAATERVEASGRFIIALSGGSTPAILYRTLARAPYRSQLPWRQLYVFWGDERWVPPNDPESNEGLAQQELLAHVPVPAANVRPIVTQGLTPEAAATLAEQEFRILFPRDADPQMDLILLGLGEDGHTASLFPGSPAVGEREALFTANRLASGVVRITATVTLINQAQRALFFVVGKNKARALRQVLHPEPETTVLPASLVRASDGEVTWIVDEDAASLLPEDD